MVAAAAASTLPSRGASLLSLPSAKDALASVTWALCLHRGIAPSLKKKKPLLLQLDKERQGWGVKTECSSSYNGGVSSHRGSSKRGAWGGRPVCPAFCPPLLPGMMRSGKGNITNCISLIPSALTAIVQSVQDGFVLAHFQEATEIRLLQKQFASPRFPNYMSEFRRVSVDSVPTIKVSAQMWVGTGLGGNLACPMSYHLPLSNSKLFSAASLWSHSIEYWPGNPMHKNCLLVNSSMLIKLVVYAYLGWMTLFVCFSFHNYSFSSIGVHGILQITEHKASPSSKEHRIYDSAKGKNDRTRGEGSRQG